MSLLLDCSITLQILNYYYSQIPTSFFFFNFIASLFIHNLFISFISDFSAANSITPFSIPWTTQQQHILRMLFLHIAFWKFTNLCRFSFNETKDFLIEIAKWLCVTIAVPSTCIQSSTLASLITSLYYSFMHTTLQAY